MSEGEVAILERILKRERLARKEAENLLEEKSLQLYKANESLQLLADDLDSRVKRRTSELFKQKELLGVALENAKAADKTKSAFLANMSHEIRTPLNGIIGMNRLVTSEPLSPKQEQFSEAIKVSSDALLRIIDEILDFSKIEANHLEIELEEFPILEVIDDVFDVLDIKATNNHVNFGVVYDAKTPNYVMGDSSRLRQVLLNIGGNAIKFSPEGTVCLKLKVEMLALGRCLIKFIVEDTGIGMDEVELSQLFRPFTQADSSISRRFGGTGLGLAISEKLVTLMGGQISVESEKDKGSTFRISLPFEIVQNRNTVRPFFGEQEVGFVITAVEKFQRESIGSAFEVEGLTPIRTITLNEGFSAVEAARKNGLVIWIISLAGHSSKECIFIAEKLGDLDDSVRPVILEKSGKTDLKEVLKGCNFLRWPLSRRVLLRHTGKILNISGKRPCGAQSGDECRKKIDLRSMRILLAEDNYINQEVGRFTLERLGAEVDIANNGLEALNLVSRYSYGLIFMDIRMPEMDGLEACQRIRKKGFKMPIIALTADAMKGDRERFMKVGMNGYLSKPLMEDKLSSVLLQTLSKKPESGLSESRPEPTAEHPVLDFESFLYVMGGDAEMAKSLLDEFKNWGKKLMSKGTLNLEKKEFEQAAATYHQLSGAAFSVQAVEMGEIALELERQLVGDRKSSSELFEAEKLLQEAYERLVLVEVGPPEK